MLGVHERVPTTSPMADPKLFEQMEAEMVSRMESHDQDDSSFAAPKTKKLRNNEGYFNNKKIQESLDFEENESIMWRKHQLRRFFQDKGHFWTKSRTTTLWKWILVTLIGILVGLCGAFVRVFVATLLTWKFDTAKEFIASDKWASSFFSYQFMSLFFALVATTLCYFEPAAAGSGIPEIKALLNGVNLKQFVKFRVLMAKLVGMCFSVASGLPTGKKGPIIHIGSTMGAAVSQGMTITFGFDTSWTKFQDFRNDRSKRDFVTYGCAAGVSAMFHAPIGGVLFALEEGASHWSSTLTFRTFFCAMVAVFTISLLFADHKFGTTKSNTLFVFGQFIDLDEGKTNYRVYELFIFILLGISGGVIGAFFNVLHKKIALYNKAKTNTPTKKIVRVLLFTFGMACISFILPLLWQRCTDKPSGEDIEDWTQEEIDGLDELVQFQCKDGQYNEVASLFFCSADAAIRNLFHFREYKGSDYATFGFGPLFLFFLPYFLMTACTAGLDVPLGLFVPSILMGAAYGRFFGHALNKAFPGYVADSGTYAFMGAAAINGGIQRMTLSMTIIMLETAGNMTYLLPLMLTFGAARYAGKAINIGIYDLQMSIKEFPFLESSLHTLGLLNYNPVTEIMATPVVTFQEIERVEVVYNALLDTKHNGFPILDLDSKFRGLILRKTLCTLLELRAFSAPLTDNHDKTRRLSFNVDENGTQLAPAATVFYDTLEKKYPNYPDIKNIKLTTDEMNLYIDLRPYMDTAAYMIHQSASVQRCHRLFRTMGLRHLIVVDGDHRVVGLITRKDITERTLKAHWYEEGQHLEKFINVEPLPPAVIYDKRPDTEGGGEASLTKSKLFEAVDDPENGDVDDASSDSTGDLEGGDNNDDIEESPTFHQTTRKPNRQSEFVGKWPTLPTPHAAMPTMPTMPTMPSVYNRNKKT